MFRKHLLKRVLQRFAVADIEQHAGNCGIGIGRVEYRAKDIVFRPVDAQFIGGLQPDIERYLVGNRRDEVAVEQEWKRADLAGEAGSAGQRTGLDDLVGSGRITDAEQVDRDYIVRAEICRTGDIVERVRSRRGIDGDAQRRARSGG